MARLLVTGANGTLGQELVSRLGLYETHTVMGTDSTDLNLNWDEKTIHTVLDAMQPDIILNTAAFTQVDAAERQPELASVVNSQGPQYLASWVQRQPSRYLIQISTDYVFDGEKGNPYEPADTPHPVNVYGKSKLAGERAVLTTAPTQSLIFRTSWLFGPDSKNFVPFIIQAAQAQTPIRVTDDQWGTPTWTGTVCKLILETLDTKPTGIVHGCATGQTTRYEQAVHLCHCLNVSTDFMTRVSTDNFGFPAKRPRNTAMQTSFSTVPDWQTATEKFLLTQGLMTASAVGKSHV